MEFSQKLKILRLEKDLTQLELSNELGINVKSYQRYELGDRFPAIDILESIARFYKIELFCLFTKKRIEKVPKTKLNELIQNHS